MISSYFEILDFILKSVIISQEFLSLFGKHIDNVEIDIVKLHSLARIRDVMGDKQKRIW